MVVSIPHHVLGEEPYAVVADFKGRSQQEVCQRVREVFGSGSALGGVVSLKQLGWTAFPMNATRKIVKGDVKAAARSYVRGKRNA